MKLTVEVVVLVQQVYKELRFKRFFSRLLFTTVASEYLLSFATSFLFFFVIFLINQLIVIARDVMSQNVDIFRSLLLLWFSTPAVAALSFPFGSLVGALLCVARITADNEMLAIQSLGMSVRVVFVPLFLLSMGLTFVSFSLNNALLPLGFVSYRNLRDELLYSNTELILSPYSVTRFNDTTIITDQVKDGLLTSVLLFDAGEAGRTRIISAQTAQLNKEFKNSGVLQLDLEKASILEQGENFNDLDQTTLDSMSYSLRLQDLVRDQRYMSPAEMSFVDIGKRITEMEAKLNLQINEHQKKLSQETYIFMQKYLANTTGAIGEGLLDVQTQYDLLLAQRRQKFTDRNLQLHKVEYWKKLSIPVACTTLVMLGFPLGLYAKKSARGLGFGLGLLIAVLYWGSILAGQFLSMSDPSSNAALYMWAPNIVFILVGVTLQIFGMKR